MTVVGALLAGGESRRMGRDKSAIVVGGQTLAERALATLRSVSDRQVVLGHGRGCPDDVPRLPDAAAGEGPSAGLRALLHSGLGDVYVVLPVDMPGVRPEHLTQLLAAGGQRDAACFTVAGELEPLPCVLAARASPPAGERRLARLLAALSPALVPLPETEAALLRNLNNPEDLDAEGRRGPGFG